MFDQLLATDGVIETSELVGRVGFMALHGGLEPATYEIAHAAAASSGSSVYSVRQPHELYWHIPSIEFDPTVSPALASFLGHVGMVISLHGFGRPGLEASMLLGGNNRSFATRVAQALRGAGFHAIDELERIPAALRGTHPRNPVNLAEAAGVQIEIGPGLRSDTDTVARLAGALGKVADAEMRSLCARVDC